MCTHTHTDDPSGEGPRPVAQSMGKALLRAPGLPSSRHLCLPDTGSFPALCVLPLPAAGSPAAYASWSMPASQVGRWGPAAHPPRPYLRSHFIKLRPPLKQRPSPGPRPHPGHRRGLGRLGLTAPCLHDTLQLHIGACVPQPVIRKYRESSPLPPSNNPTK